MYVDQIFGYRFMKFAISFITFILTKVYLLATAVDSECKLEKFAYFEEPNYHIVYKFQCFNDSINNPVFPEGGSFPSEYTDVILSPNVYNRIPIEYLSQFSYIRVLNMSKNKLTNLTNGFKLFGNLKNLKIVSFDHNMVSSPIICTDFDDEFAERLESLDLSFNMIPSIETSVFIKSDGTSRFKNLKYLNLASNQLKEFDLLWPLTLPSSTLTVDLNTNFITSLTNPLSKSFKEAVFQNPMRNNRTVNIQDNALTVFNDSNLLQYGIQSVSDLNTFWRMIANYDLTQSGRSNIITCICPVNGLYTVTWYRQLIRNNIVEAQAPINQLYCSNLPEVYVLSFECLVKKIAIYNASQNPGGTYPSEIHEIDDIILVTSISTKDPHIPPTSHWFLLFLIVPVFIVSFLFYLILSRPIHKCMFNICTTLWCLNMCKPGDKKKSGKVYDATICYNMADHEWVKSSLVSTIGGFGKPYRLRLLGYNSEQNRTFNLEEIEMLRASKRVILVISKQFINNMWSNLMFKNEIKHLYTNDRNCVIIGIYMDCYSLQTTYDIFEEFDTSANGSFFNERIKLALGLKRVERIQYSNLNFREQLYYLMPVVRNKTKLSLIICEEEATIDNQSLNPTYNLDNVSISIPKYLDSETIFMDNLQEHTKNCNSSLESIDKIELEHV